jgi:hypothetical protein
MQIWSEFKQVVLPLLVAAAVVGLLEWRHGREAARWERAIAAHAAAIEQQAAAVDKIGDLLATQGYTLPPLAGTPLPQWTASASR